VQSSIKDCRRVVHSAQSRFRHVLLCRIIIPTAGGGCIDRRAGCSRGPPRTYYTRGSWKVYKSLAFIIEGTAASAAVTGRIFFFYPLWHAGTKSNIIYYVWRGPRDVLDIPLNEMLRTVGLFGGSVMDFTREDLRRFWNRLPTHCYTNKWLAPHKQFWKRNITFRTRYINYNRLWNSIF